MSGHETSDVPPRGVLATAAGLFGFVLLSAALVAAMLAWLAATPPPPPTRAQAIAAPPPPPPRLQTDEPADRAAIEAAAQARLHGYAWLDRAGGRARIPIASAMRILAERGWPDAEPAK